MNTEEIRNKLLEHGYTLLTKEYKSNKQLLEYEKDGYIYSSSYNCLTRTYNPKKWGVSNPHSIENLNLYFKENEYPCKLLSKEYSDNRLEFSCKCGNKYNALIGRVVSGNNTMCKDCAILERAKKFIKPEKEKVFEKYGCKLIEEYTNGNDYLYFIDKDGYYASASSDSLEAYNGNYQKFTIKNKYLIQNIDRYIEINNLNCKLITRDIYDCKLDNLEFKCSCGNSFYLSLNTFLTTKKNTCNKCSLGSALKKKISYSIDEFNRTIKENKLIQIDEYIGKTNKTYFINEFGYYVYLSLNSIKSNKTLNHSIFNKVNKYTIENIKNYIKLNNLSCELLSNKYNGKNNKLKFKCKCGNIYYCKTYDLRFRNGDHCKECGKINIKSKMEVAVKQWLTDNNINHIGEKTFIGCFDKQLLPFDFYLQNHNICIECQGKQHYQPIEYFGGVERYEYTIKHDKIKKEYCIKNNIEYLEISYLDLKDNKYIEILEKHINKLH